MCLAANEARYIILPAAAKDPESPKSASVHERGSEGAQLSPCELTARGTLTRSTRRLRAARRGTAAPPHDIALLRPRDGRPNARVASDFFPRTENYSKMRERETWFLNFYLFNRRLTFS